MQPETGDDIEMLVERACTADDPTDLATLAKVYPGILRPFHRRLVDAGFVWPPELYYGMDEDTAAHIVKLIDGRPEAAGRLLSVLVTTPTATAAAAVTRWQAVTPDWTAEFFWPVSRYPHIGGWELDNEGRIRRLTSPSAHALVPNDGTGISGGVLNESCGWCGMALWRVLDIEGIVAGTCIRCGCYTTIFTDQDLGGAVRWAVENSRPQFLGRDDDTWELPDDVRLHVGAARPTSYSGTAWDAGGSTLGGLPDWIQDPEYPACPRCDKTMTYRGMITGPDLWGEAAEGCHYVFADTDCHMSAVVYQQS